MKMYRTISLISLAILLAACGKSENSNEGEASIKQKNDQVTYEASGQNGEKVTITASEKGVALPDDFPKDIPSIKDGVVRSSMSEGKQLFVQIAWKGSISDAAKFYEDGMKTQGWAIESKLNTGEMTVIAAKKDNRQCTVTVAGEDGEGSVIQIGVMQDE